MRRLLRWIGTVILFAAVAVCLAPAAIMPFLDRIYYRGPPSDHFDGERFFNPGAAAAPPARQGPGRYLNRWAQGDERPRWPGRVPVSPSVPPRRVEAGAMLATWIGHATVLVQTEGLNILTDPIWSERASPFSFIGPKRVRAPGVRFDDLPRIDLVLVSHNHYDHLDLPTLRRLWERDRPLIVTGLGNDTVLAAAGIPARALDWGGETAVRPRCAAGARCAPAATVRVLRNHHWSSRWGTDRNRALWSAFRVATAAGGVFFAGDTGWGDGSWVEEAAGAGPYRLAIVPIGAYEPRDFMKNSHIDPAEAVAIYQRLRPDAALGVHWGTFRLTFEAIGDPPRRLAGLRRARGIPGERFVATEVGRTFAVPAR